MRETKTPPAGSFFWQITFPILSGGLLLTALTVWMILAASQPAISRFAEISTVLLVIPVLIASLIPLAILGAMVFGLSWLIGHLPVATGWIQQRVAVLTNVLSRISNLAVEPVIRPLSLISGLSSLVRTRGARRDEIPLEND